MSQDQLNDLQPSDVPSQDNGHSKAQPQPPDPNQNIESERKLIKILTMWAKHHGAPDTWKPRPTLVKWLIKWKAEP